MKSLSLVLNIVLAIAVAVLYVLHFSGEKQEIVSGCAPVNMVENDSVQTQTCPIAYINVDSLLRKYNFYSVLEDKMLSQYQAAEGEVARKEGAFMKEVEEFKKKEQSGGFLSQASYESQAKDLMQKEQTLAARKQEMSAELVKLQQGLDKQLLDSVNTYLKVYNAEKNYQYILNSVTFLHAEEAFNITNEIVEGLNQRYEASKEE